MPKLGMSMTTGVIGTWLVLDGTHVIAEQEIAEIETDKITTPLLAEKSGYFYEVLPVDSEVEVGTIIGLLSSEALMDDELLEIRRGRVLSNE